MKINVEVDLNSIWPDFEDDASALGKQVESAIAEEVKNKVWNLVRDQVNKTISNAVYATVESQVSNKVDAYIESFLLSGTIKTSATSEPIAIKDLVESFITSQKAWTGFSQGLAKIAENYAKEAQKKYDLVFATQIVMSLKDSGMLDKDKLQLLFQDSKEQ